MEKIILITLILTSSILFGAKPAKFELPLPKNAKILDVGPKAYFKTIDDAIIRVEKMRKKDTKTPLAIRIAPGDYVPKKTLSITKAHSSVNTAPLFICAADFNKKPRIIGGDFVRGWKKTTFNGRKDVWVADASKLTPSKDRKLLRLAFNGKRMMPSRYPNVDKLKPYTGSYAVPAKSEDPYYEDEIKMRPEDRRKWAHPEDGVIYYCPGGAAYGWQVASINGFRDGTIQFDKNHIKRKHRWGRWCVQNIAEELDAPGEWYYDPRAMKIYLITPDGSDPNKALVTLERPKDVISIYNGGGNCTIAGLEIVGGRTGICLGGSDEVSILACSIHDIGGFGIYGGSGIYFVGRRGRIEDCDIYNVGSEGIIVHSLGDDANFDSRHGTIISNNYFHHCGEICHDGPAIFNCGQGVTITHNLIHDMPRTAICGYGRFCDISYNRIRHTNLMSSDGGAMYDSGWTQGAGSTIRYNSITDAIGLRQAGEWDYIHGVDAAGIYFDECTGGTTVYGNFVANCHWTGIMIHNARWLTVSNNVFVSNGWRPVWHYTHQVEISSWFKAGFANNKFRRACYMDAWGNLTKKDNRWKQLPSLAQNPYTDEVYSNDGSMIMGLKFFNNIFSFPDQGGGVVLYGAGVNMTTNLFETNLYWPGYGKEPRFATRVYKKENTSWFAWQTEKVQDNKSLIDDPLFKNPAKGDFRVKDNSPAFKIGFKELPYEEMGLMVTKFRPVLPKEAEGVRENPKWLARVKKVEQAKSPNDKSPNDK